MFARYSFSNARWNVTSGLLTLNDSAPSQLFILHIPGVFSLVAAGFLATIVVAVSCRRCTITARVVDCDELFYSEMFTDDDHTSRYVWQLYIYKEPTTAQLSIRRHPMLNDVTVPIQKFRVEKHERVKEQTAKRRRRTTIQTRHQTREKASRQYLYRTAPIIKILLLKVLFCVWKSTETREI